MRPIPARVYPRSEGTACMRQRGRRHYCRRQLASSTAFPQTTSCAHFRPAVAKLRRLIGRSWNWQQKPQQQQQQQALILSVQGLGPEMPGRTWGLLRADGESRQRQWVLAHLCMEGRMDGWNEGCRVAFYVHRRTPLIAPQAFAKHSWHDGDRTHLPGQSRRPQHQSSGG